MHSTPISLQQDDDDANTISIDRRISQEVDNMTKMVEPSNSRQHKIQLLSSEVFLVDELWPSSKNPTGLDGTPPSAAPNKLLHQLETAVVISNATPAPHPTKRKSIVRIVSGNNIEEAPAVEVIEPIRVSVLPTLNSITSTSTSTKKAKTSTPPAAMATMTSNTVVEVIEPGLVCIRNFLPDEECQRLAGTALSFGDGKDCKDADGFFAIIDGKRELNTGESRGRIYDAVTRFPPYVGEHCDRAVQMARDSDPMMPGMNCSHLLLNMYTTSEGLVWHRDVYENDGRSDHPVVNLCVGAACKFGVKHRDEDPDRVITLRSGDCLLFGGPCRLIKHAVLEVLLDECPTWMKFNPARFSFTFRDSPEVLGREVEFKYFRVQEHLVGQEEFDKTRVDPQKRSGLPSLQSQREGLV